MNLLKNWIVTEHIKMAVEGPCLICIVMWVLDSEHKKFSQ